MATLKSIIFKSNFYDTDKICNFLIIIIKKLHTYHVIEILLKNQNGSLKTDKIKLNKSIYFNNITYTKEFLSTSSSK